MRSKIRTFPAGLLLIGLVMVSFLAAREIPSAKPAALQTPPLVVEAVANNLYAVKGGSGATAGFYVTEKEVFVIDAKMDEETAARMLEEIAKTTDAPVTTLILTHSDGDHINGLAGFPKGLRIISHVNCKADVEAAVEGFPFLKDYIPDTTYDQQFLSLYREADGQIDLLHFGPAHTNGDTIVWFPREKAVFMGDLIFIGRDPLIHRHKNGNSFGYVKTLKATLKLSPAVEIFLSGHADPVSRADIEALAASIEEKQVRIKAMVDEGLTLEEIRKAFGIEVPTEQSGRRRWPPLVETIYLELTEKNST